MQGMGDPSQSRDRAINRVLREQTACTTVLPSVVRAPVRDRDHRPIRDGAAPGRRPAAWTGDHGCTKGALEAPATLPGHHGANAPRAVQ